ncbi:MAG: signal transduction histidine kinase, partial [Burkholderiaceae bacterium]
MTAPDSISSLQRQLADLQELMAWLDAEQQRQHDVLADEVHDQLGSSLTALAMRLALIERQSAAGSDLRITEQWIKNNALLSGITHTARRLQHQLRPIALEALGLHAILADYLDAFSIRTETPCTLSVSGPEPDLSLESVQCLFRLLQESFSNIERHAGTCQVQVALSTDNQQCRLS